MPPLTVYYIGQNTSLELSFATWSGRSGISVRRLVEERLPVSLPSISPFLWIARRYDTIVPEPIARLAKAARSCVILPHSAFSLARQALDAGFANYLCIPCTEAVLFQKLDRLARFPAEDFIPATTPGTAGDISVLRIVYGSESIDKLETVARLPTTVTLTGPAGMQPVRLARMVHELSDRCNGPFVPVPVRSLSRRQIQDLFSGTSDAPGLFESAAGGTLYLEDIEFLENAQQQMLRANLSVPLGPEGATHGRTWRLIIYTNPDNRLAAHQLDPLLGIQLGVYVVPVLPLGNRYQAIAAAASEMLPRLAAGLNLPPRRVSPQAMDRLMKHSWPGNLDELRIVLEHALIQSDGAEITPDKLKVGDSSLLAPLIASPLPTSRIRSSDLPD